MISSPTHTPWRSHVQGGRHPVSVHGAHHVAGLGRPLLCVVRLLLLPGAPRRAAAAAAPGLSRPCARPCARGQGRFAPVW